MEQVKAALDPEEPDYAKAAKQLGADALPHLEKIIGGSDTSLAAKATYLAGLIGGDRSVPAVAKAARSTQAVVRIAAAAAAAHLPAQHSDAVLLQLVDDADHGVQKLAMRSAPAAMSDALRARVSALQAAFAAPAAPARAQTVGKKKVAKKARATKTRPARKTNKKAKRKKTR
jgi:HEAT repeat protein